MKFKLMFSQAFFLYLVLIFKITIAQTFYNPVNNIQQNNVWESIGGPDGGYVYTIAVKDGLIFAGGNGGVFVSADSGKTWANSGLIGIKINEIISRGVYLFVAASQRGVYCSSDNGKTWNRSVNGLPNYYDVVNIAYHNGVLYAALFDQGIYRSFDLGQNWQACNNNINNLSIRNLFEGDSSIIASAAGAGGSGMFRTTNNGDNWNRLDPYQFAWNAERMSKLDSTIYGVDFENNAHIKTSSDDGNSWNYPINSFAPDDIITSIFVDNSGLYAGTDHHGIYFSKDKFGRQWIKISNGLKDVVITCINRIGNNIIIGTNNGIYSSSITSFLWHFSSKGLNNNIVSSIIINDNKIICGTSGSGNFVSSDTGNSWEQNSIIRNYISDFHKEDSIFVAIASNNFYLYRGEAYYSFNAISWSRFILGQATSTIAKNSKYIFAGTESGLYRLNSIFDNGVKVLDGWFPYSNNRAIACADSIVIAITNGVMRSSNNGTTWQQINNRDLAFSSCVFNINNNFYIGLEQVNRILVSKNMGVTWKELPVTLVNSSVKNIVGKDNFLAAGLSRGGVIVSYDTGNTWQRFNFGLSNYYVQSIFLDDSMLYAGTNGNGIYSLRLDKQAVPENKIIDEIITKDTLIQAKLIWNAIIPSIYYELQLSKSPELDTLVYQNNLITQPSIIINDLEYSTNYYIKLRGVTVNGYKSNWIVGTFQTPEQNNFEPNNYFLSQNYPNPFNPSTTINYEIPKASIVTIKVYDILGREVAQLVNEEKPAGSYNVTFNASKYSSGVYFYRITAGDFSQIKKMVLLK